MLMDPVVLSAEIIGDPLAQDDVSRLVCSFVPWCLPWPSWPGKSIGAGGCPKFRTLPRFPVTPNMGH